MDGGPQKDTKFLYEALKGKGLYTKSYEEFTAKYSDPANHQKLYDVVTREKMYTKDMPTFIGQYFPGEKKKTEPNVSATGSATFGEPSSTLPTGESEGSGTEQITAPEPDFPKSPLEPFKDLTPGEEKPVGIREGIANLATSNPNISQDMFTAPEKSDKPFEWKPSAGKPVTDLPKTTDTYQAVTATPPRPDEFSDDEKQLIEEEHKKVKFDIQSGLLQNEDPKLREIAQYKRDELDPGKFVLYNTDHERHPPLIFNSQEEQAIFYLNKALGSYKAAGEFIQSGKSWKDLDVLQQWKLMEAGKTYIDRSLYTKFYPRTAITKGLDVTPEDLHAWEKATGSDLDSKGLENLVDNFFNGLITGVGQSMHGGHLIGEKIVQAVGITPDKTDWGLSVMKMADEMFPTNPDLRSQFMSQLFNGAGSMGSFAIGGGLGMSMKVPAWVTAGTMGAVQNGASEYDNAIAAGKTPEEAFNTFLISIPAGAIEGVPFVRTMGMANKVTQGRFAKNILPGVMPLIRGGTEEGLQEFTSAWMNNLTAREMYDYSRQLVDDQTFNQVTIGVILGSAMSLGQQDQNFNLGPEQIDMINKTRENMSIILNRIPKKFNDIKKPPPDDPGGPPDPLDNYSVIKVGEIEGVTTDGEVREKGGDFFIQEGEALIPVTEEQRSQIIEKLESQPPPTAKDIDELTTPPKENVGSGVGGDVEISDKEVSDWAKDNGYNISDKEDFDTATKMATQRPNHGMGNMIFGKEERTEERKDVHTYTYEKNGKTLKWNLGVYENGNGGKRYLLYEEQYPDQIDAGAIVDKEGKVAHIRTENDFRGIGLAQTLLREIQKDYGKIIPSEPISKQGAKAIYRFEKAQPLPTKEVEESPKQITDEVSTQTEETTPETKGVLPEVGTPEYKSGQTHIPGRTVTRTTPSKQKLKGQYKVVPMDEVLASHNEQTFSQTEGFPKRDDGTTPNDRDYSSDKNAQSEVIRMGLELDERAIDQAPIVTRDGIVVDGNNRTMSRKRAAHEGTDQDYLEALKEKAEMYGIDPALIDQVKNPMLIFETIEDLPYTTETFQKFNRQEKKEKSPIDKAIEISKTIPEKAKRRIFNIWGDAKRMSDVTSDKKKVKEMVQAFQEEGILQSNEIPRYFDPEKLTTTKEGVAFMETLLMGSALDENAIRALDSENMGDVRNKVISAVVPLVKNSTMGEHSLISELSEAIEIINGAKKSEQSIIDYVRQSDMFAEKKVDATAFVIADALQKPDFNKFINNWNENVGKYEIFEQKTRTKEDAVRDYIRKNIGEKAETRLGLIFSSKGESGRSDVTPGTDSGQTEEVKSDQNKNVNSQDETDKGQNKGTGTLEKNTDPVRYNGSDAIGQRSRTEPEKAASRKKAKEKISSPETNASLKTANDYNKSVGLPEIQDHEFKPSEKEVQSKIGETYEQLQDVTSPTYKETELERQIFDSYKSKYPELFEKYGIKSYKDLVEKSYAEFAKEANAQFEALPLKIEFHEGDHNYESSAEMLDDVHNFGHLWVFKGGEDHTLLGSKTIDKNGLTANDKFRAVHDYFGHSIKGYQFGKDGEENAWIEHSKMFSPLAQLALSSETRGQNSFVNYSGVNDVALEKMKLAAALNKKGIEENNQQMIDEGKKLLDEANTEFQFAEQKAIILPEEYTNAKKFLKESDPGQAKEIKAEKPQPKKVKEKKKKPRFKPDPKRGQAVSFKFGGVKYRGYLKNGVITEIETGHKHKANSKTISEIRQISQGKSVEEGLEQEGHFENIGDKNNIFAPMAVLNFLSTMKSGFIKAFRPRQHLPMEVFKDWLKIELSEATALKEILKTRVALDRALKIDYGRPYNKLRAQQKNQLDLALREPVIRMNLPDNTRIVIQAMRDQVDRLSQAAIDEGVVDGDLEVIFRDNLGVYLTRSYRKYDEKDWAKKVPEITKQRARNFLINEYPGASHDQITGLLNHILTSPDAPVSLLRNSKLGNKNIDVLKKRKDIPVELRQLMGEYQEPLINYAKSMFQISSLVARHKFLQSVRRNGLNVFLFEEATGDYYVPVASAGSKTMEPLNGLYTTPEIAEAFANFEPQSISNDGLWNSIFRLYMGMNALVKVSKTVLSPVTHVRNFLSNVTFLISNGYVMEPSLFKNTFTGGTSTFKDLFNLGNTDFNKKLYRLTELGVIGDATSAGELRQIIQDANKKGSGINDILNQSLLTKLTKPLGKLYQAEDDFFKIISFETELKRLQNAYGTSKSIEELEEMAAKKTRLVMPTYSLVPRIIKELRKTPLVGSFPSFPAEIVRTYFNTWQLAIRELNTKNERSIGVKRLSGIIMATALIPALVKFSRAMIGVDEEEERALREFMPPWSKNSDIIWLSRGSDGLPRYIDAGYSDPYNYLRKPLNALFLGIKNQDAPIEVMTTMVKELLKPFANEEILIRSIRESISNKKDDTGSEVYNPAGTWGEKAEAIFKHVGKALEPGMLSTGRRLFMAYTGEKTVSGKTYNLEDELLTLMTGQRFQRIDPATSIIFMTRDLSTHINDARGLYTVVKHNARATDEQKEKALARANRRREQYFNEYRIKYEAAKTLMLRTQSPEAVRKSLINTMMMAKIPPDIIYSLATSGPYKGKFLP